LFIPPGSLLTSTCAGVSDRHNDYGAASKHDTASIIPGHNITEAGHGSGESAGRPGETKFDSHSFKENDGFRDTHSEEPNPQNGSKFKFEDHKEDSAREGKDVQVHSSDPNGERVDGNGHYFKEAHDGVDVKDFNGATDTVHKNTSGTQFHGMFQKHHAGPDNSDSHDSKLTHSGALDSQHQKEEHKDPKLHTMHETSSGKGTWSFNMVGNNALGDLAQESKNWPEQGQISQTGKPGWGNSLPKNEGEMNEASKVDWVNSPHTKRQHDEMLVEKHKARPQHANPLLPEPLRVLPPSDEGLMQKREARPEGSDSPHTDPDEFPECCKNKGKHHHSSTESQPPFDEKVVDKRASELKDPDEEVPECCKHKHFYHSGTPIEVPLTSEEITSPTNELLIEKRASDPKDPDEEVPECCRHKGKQSSTSTQVHPPTDEKVVEKRASGPLDLDSPAEKAKHGALGPGKYFVPTDPDLSENMYSAPTEEEMQAEWREDMPTPSLEPKHTPAGRIDAGHTYTPAEVAANAQLRDVARKPNGKKPAALLEPLPPIFPTNPPEKRSIDEMLVHKHNVSPDAKGESKMPPSKRSVNEDQAALKMAIRPNSGDNAEMHIQARDSGDKDLLSLPGHPYLVGHAAANAVQANAQPTQVSTTHDNPVAFEALPSQLVARSPAELDPTDIEYGRNIDHLQGWAGSSDHKSSIYVLPTREHASHKDDSRINTIQICTAVIMAICLALCLGFLVWWVPRKVMARRSRKRAAITEMEQRDVELAELNEELDREVVDAAAGAKKEGGQ